MPSFQPMSATLQPEYWGLHGGMPADVCDRSLPNARKQCIGGNPMNQRKYPCDTLIQGYFGTDSASLDQVGESDFKSAAAAITVKLQIESYRGGNIFGLLTWQLNEIWPTVVAGAVSCTEAPRSGGDDGSHSITCSSARSTPT